MGPRVYQCRPARVTPAGTVRAGPSLPNPGLQLRVASANRVTTAPRGAPCPYPAPPASTALIPGSLRPTGTAHRDTIARSALPPPLRLEIAQVGIVVNFSKKLNFYFV